MLHELKKTGRVLRSEGAREVTRKTAGYLKKLLIDYPKCRMRMRTLSSTLTLPETIDYVFHGTGKLLLPAQVESEVRRFFTMIETLQPKVVLEIGTGAGGMLLLFTRIAAADATIVTIDLRGGEYGGGYAAWRAPLYQSFARPDQSIRLVRADSHAPATVDRVRELLGGRAVDILFIDGDHSYQGVKTDLENYRPLLAADGLTAFHDIVEADPRMGLEVSKLWRELKPRFDTLEIVESWDQGGFGIGALRNPGRGPDLDGFAAATATDRSSSRAS